MNDTEDETTFSVLARAAQRTPDAEALIFPQVRVTYAQLLGEAERAAQALIRLGIRPGDRLAIAIPGGKRFATYFYAAGRAGAVVVPVNPRFTVPEADYVLRQSGAVAVIAATAQGITDFSSLYGELTADESAGLRAVVWAGDEGTSAAAAGQGEPGWPAVSADDVALIQYTSGSTAFPKGARLRHRSIVRDAFHVGTRMRLVAGDRIFSGSPPYHVGGTVLHLLLAHVHGAAAVGLPAYRAAQALDMIESEQCVMFSGVEPHFLLALSDPAFDRHRVRSVQKIISTGSPAVLRRIAREMDVPGVVALYGLSETSSNITMADVEDPAEWRLDTCGYPHPDTAVVIRPPDADDDLATGAVGEICVRGYNLMTGYHEMPDATAAAFTTDGWFRTGDLGVLDDRGLLHFRGRLKDVIRVGGENVSAAEVEGALSEVTGTTQVAVVRAPDPQLGEVPVAFVTLAEGQDPDEFRERATQVLSTTLATFKRPRKIIIRDSMPMTGSGKIHKPTLEEQL